MKPKFRKRAKRKRMLRPSKILVHIIKDNYNPRILQYWAPLFDSRIGKKKVKENV